MLTTSLLVLALALVLLPALYAFIAELLSPSAQYPEAGYHQRIGALRVQQALSLPGLVLILLLPFFSADSSSTLLYWVLSVLLWLVQIPLFWLRAVDLGQAVRSVNWVGAKKRNSQIQMLLLLQVLLALIAFGTGVEWTGSPQSA